MNLKKSIEWANKLATNYNTYFVELISRDSYALADENQLNRNPKLETVYDSSNKKINIFLIHLSQCNFASRKVRKSVATIRETLEPCYICIKSYPGGPATGEVIRPYYHSAIQVDYRFTNSDGKKIKYSRSKMLASGLNFKVYSPWLDLIESSKLIKNKKLQPKTRWGKLMTHLK